MIIQETTKNILSNYIVLDNLISESHEPSDNSYIVGLDELANYLYRKNQNLNESISVICESNRVHSKNLTVCVNEYELLEHLDLVPILSSLIKNGYNVYISPLSEDDYISKLGDLILEIADDTNNHKQMLNLFCEDDTFGIDPDDDKFVKFLDVWRKDRIKGLKSDYGGYIGFEDLVKSNGYNTEKIISELQRIAPIIDYDSTVNKLLNILRSYPSTLSYNDIENIKKQFKQYVESTEFIFRTEANGYIRGSLGTQETQDKIRHRLFHYRKTNFEINNAGHFLNQKEARETEEGFNAAKQKELERLKYIGAQVGNQDVNGTDDPDIQNRLNDLAKRIEEEKFPKSWLAKKIAWLRSLYRNIMIKWSIRKEKFNAMNSMGTAFYGDVARWYKRIAAWILRLIDKLLLKLQNTVS